MPSISDEKRRKQEGLPPSVAWFGVVVGMAAYAVFGLVWLYVGALITIAIFRYLAGLVF